jgi:hypothetical protein
LKSQQGLIVDNFKNDIAATRLFELCQLLLEMSQVFVGASGV